MFTMRDFVMKAIRKIIGTEPEYKVRLRALAWLEREVLEERDLSEIEERLAAMNAAAAAAEEARAESEQEEA